MEDLVDDWGDLYRRERSFLSRILNHSSKNNNTTSTNSTTATGSSIVQIDTTYEEFSKLLLEAAAYSCDVYTDVRRVIHR